MFNAAAIDHIVSASFDCTDKIDITYPQLWQHPFLTVSMHRTKGELSVKTYCSISSLLQNSLARSSCQRLGTSDDPICAMHSTSPTREWNEVGVQSRVDGFRIEGHFGLNYLLLRSS